ncbi:uncharacterized protein LOC126374567 [Pectinophora gossypiella]|uniref:uncharacterized protein LOC126374567 n=1 Tax=Pectinophora gossypiella TaxID=13191 RepID=UPI00214E6C5B|nr:uncharacterized protein LOC126374567 [Pectinophora gossypiella]
MLHNISILQSITFVCQMQREYYKGYPNRHHPYSYFDEGQYRWQCPPEMSSVYLSYPPYHVKYKQPVVLPPTTERTSDFPPMPGRTLAGRYNKGACKAFVR